MTKRRINGSRPARCGSRGIYNSSPMKLLAPVSFLLAVLLGLNLMPRAAAAETRPAFRVLVFSKTLGYRHASITDGIAAIRNLGATNGFAMEATEDSSAFTAANLARFQAVVFLSVTGAVLDADQERALRNYIEAGGGFAAIHGAIFGPKACEDKWAWYGEMFGCTFTNHSKVLPATVVLEDAAHPANIGLPSHWERTDEWYNYTGTPRSCAHILATVDESTYHGGTVGIDHPIAWCRPVGQGRMWFTAMGHTESSFSEPLFLKHLLGGIQYVVSSSLKLIKENTVIKATIAKRPLFEYRFAPEAAFKPYIFPLYSPGGVSVLRDAVPDHIHHHGLMFAIGVNGVTFWEEKTKALNGGHQIPLQTDARGDRITQQLDWRSTNGAVLLHETRTITPHTNQSVTLLTWRSRLETPPGTNAVTLSGHHYYGLGARLLQSMDRASLFMNSTGQAGEIVRGDERLVPSAWVAGTGPAADGQPVTIALFDHPDNLRYPAKKFTMSAPFAYLSTTLNWNEPLQLKAGAPLDLCYGVAVWDGKMDADQIDQAFQSWLKSAKSP